MKQAGSRPGKGGILMATLTAEDKHDSSATLKCDEERTRRYGRAGVEQQRSRPARSPSTSAVAPLQWIGKISACSLLGRLGDAEAVETLRGPSRGFQPPGPPGRAQEPRETRRQETYSGDEVAELVSYLEHPSWWVKTGALRNLSLIRDKRALEPVSQLLLDEDESCAKRPAPTLEEINRKTLRKRKAETPLHAALLPCLRQLAREAARTSQPDNSPHRTGRPRAGRIFSSIARGSIYSRGRSKAGRQAVTVDASIGMPAALVRVGKMD